MTTDAQWQAFLARHAADLVESEARREAINAAAAVEVVSEAAINERVAMALVLCESEP